MPAPFLADVEAVGRKLGVAGTRWRRRPTAFQFRGPFARVDDDALLRLQQQMRRRRHHLIANPIPRGGADDRLLLFETDAKYEVIAQVGPNVPNEGLDTQQIISWLRALEANGHAFQLMGCSEDTVVGMFDRAIGRAAAGAVAPEFKKFCRDILLTVPGRRTVDSLAAHMAAINGFVLAWVRWEQNLK